MRAQSQKEDVNNYMNPSKGCKKSETKCPKPKNDYSISTSNRYEILEEIDTEYLDEDDHTMAASKINTKEKKRTSNFKDIGLFDSYMIKLAKSFPKSIKPHFEAAKKRIGELYFA